ncbi:hypothetical protein DFH94DRAFT_681023 [Russula ochroleuca]|uniref:Uncharacterized protein n=1 Tax=Russula ochroleuca TaxID=152965 RepID=A0A9P5MY34_9AGAM|nr:hypothetical protein DFH94DRAFT_681023 [Russula ochroleuca]
MRRNGRGLGLRWSLSRDQWTVFVRPEGLAHYALARRVSLPASATAQEADADIRIPPSLAFGKMPTTTRNWQRWCAAGRKDKNMEEMSPYHETKLDVGVAQANMPAKVVDLGNTNAEVQESEQESHLAPALHQRANILGVQTGIGVNVSRNDSGSNLEQSNVN